MRLSTVEVADSLGVTEKTVRNYVNKGLLKADKKDLRNLRFDPEEVRRFAESHGLTFRPPTETK